MASAIDPRLAAMYKDATQLCGIDKPRSDIISMLISLQRVDDVPSKKITKMVSIVGVGGLGKTTVAKSAYDKLESEYDCGAFISVGQNPDLLKIFKDILFALDKYKYKNIHNTARGVDLPIREIREFLVNKRYDIMHTKYIDYIKECISFLLVITSVRRLCFYSTSGLHKNCVFIFVNHVVYYVKCELQH